MTSDEEIPILAQTGADLHQTVKTLEAEITRVGNDPRVTGFTIYAVCHLSSPLAAHYVAGSVYLLCATCGERVVTLKVAPE
jgi:hypothetical protein